MEAQLTSPTKRTKRKRKKSPKNLISKSILAKVVREIESSATFARIISLDLNIFVTIRHEDIDILNHKQKNDRREKDLNRIMQFARDNNFTTAFIWSRESERHTGNAEHLHVLLHIPSKLQLQFSGVVKKWTADVDVRKADYRIRVLPSGKSKSIIGYILKNSPQAARRTHRLYKLGGPIHGKRCGCSRNLNMKNQHIHYAPKRSAEDRAIMLRNADLLPQRFSENPQI